MNDQPLGSEQPIFLGASTKAGIWSSFMGGTSKGGHLPLAMISAC